MVMLKSSILQEVHFVIKNAIEQNSMANKSGKYN